MSYRPAGMCATAGRMCSILFASLFGPVTDWCRACLGKLMEKKQHAKHMFLKILGASEQLFTYNHLKPW